MGALEGHIVSGADLFAPHGADLAVDGDLAALDPPEDTRLANFSRSWSLMNSV